MCVLIETTPEEQNIGLCVITDWDGFCAEQDNWQKYIGKCDLNSPFYKIIKEDGSYGYIPEGNNFVDHSKKKPPVYNKKMSNWNLQRKSSSMTSHRNSVITGTWGSISNLSTETITWRTQTKGRNTHRTRASNDWFISGMTTSNKSISLLFPKPNSDRIY